MKSHMKPYYYQYRWMIQCCNNPNNPEYAKAGALGVTCHWHRGQYDEFYSWLVNTLGHRPPGTVLGRKDKAGNFAPGNLEWQTPLTRSRNKIRQNIYVKYARKTKTLTAWAEELDINYHCLRRRFNEGWTLKKIIKEYQ